MADLLLRARTVWTLDPARPRVEALGVRAGRVLALGAPAEVRRRLARPRELDLGEATVVPGLIDAHGHLLLFGQQRRAVDLAGARSAGEIAERVARRARGVPAGGWIRGRGWDQHLFPDGRFPDREPLDRLVPAHPVLLERIDGHAALVNAPALARAGIGAATPDPPGGRILRRPGGEPAGVLVDAALEPVARALPPPSPEEVEAMLEDAARACAAVGLVGAHDAGTDLDSFAALERLAARGALPLRVYAMAHRADPRFAEALAGGPRVGERLSLRAVKLFLDGALGSRGALLFEDYCDEPGGRGLWTGPEDLASALEEAMRRGFQPALHAIGDRANAAALDALEEAARRTGRRDLRPRLEHAQLLRSPDLERLAPLGAVASMQPTHVASDRAWVEARLGAERAARAYPWRALAAAGVRLAFGSDYPIEDPNPLRGLWAARTRAGWRTEGCLGAREALEGFTSGAAWAAFEEGRAGRLAPGWRADLSAFDLDPLAEPPEALLEGRALLTLVGGEVAFAR